MNKAKAKYLHAVCAGDGEPKKKYIKKEACIDVISFAVKTWVFFFAPEIAQKLQLQ
jgi:hypothetical protein